MTFDRVRLLRLPDVLERFGHGRSKLFEHIEAGLMVQPVRAGYRTITFPSDEVAAIITARTGGATNEQLRALVRALHERRQTAAAAVLAGV